MISASALEGMMIRFGWDMDCSEHFGVTTREYRKDGMTVSVIEDGDQMHLRFEGIDVSEDSINEIVRHGRKTYGNSEVMERFYFIYGDNPTAESYAENQPYKGGWTEVIAPDANTAWDLFNAVHPPVRATNAQRFATIMNDDDFFSSPISKRGNKGEFCQEVIEVRRYKKAMDVKA